MIAINSPGYEIGDGPVHLFERDRAWLQPRLLTNPEDPRHRGESYWADGPALRLATSSRLGAAFYRD